MSGDAYHAFARGAGTRASMTSMRGWQAEAVMLAVASFACSGACGDDGRAAPDAPAAPDAAPTGLSAQLAALPGVASVTQMPSATPGYDYYQLEFTQPVDHADPTGQTFAQEASLIVVHGGAATLPMIVETDGYWDYTLSDAVELTAALGAHQVSIEHRFFAGSRPSPADWSKDTIAQMAADEHAIVAALKTVFAGPYLATGASKGGMTSTYYRRFYPDDVVATVPYVAPISFGDPDPRYDAQFATIGPADGACRQAVRAAATELLQNRRAALLAAAAADAAANDYAYTRIAIGPAVETAVQGVEWAYWQYVGVSGCAAVPATTGSDAAMYAWLEQVSPVEASDDASTDLFDAYYFQAYTQLGYPDDPTPYLTPYLMYGSADYAGELPPGTTPVYDGGAAMDDIAGYIAGSGTDLLFVYGQWDPWTGGAYALGSASDAQESVVAEGTHGSQLADLAGSDLAGATAKLEQWTGIVPNLSAVAGAGRRRPQMPHVPPVLHAFAHP
jgi:hypothetical protein